MHLAGLQFGILVASWLQVGCNIKTVRPGTTGYWRFFPEEKLDYYFAMHHS